MKAITPKLSVNYFIPCVIIAALLFGTVVYFFESRLNKPIFIGAVSIGFVYVLVLGRSNRWKLSKSLLVNWQNKIIRRNLPSSLSEPRPLTFPPQDKPVDPNDIDALVEQMLAQDRYALLLRPQIAGNLSESQFGQALRVLGECMALVPDGDVQLEEGDSSRIISVQRFFLDRYPVTNRQYYEFVAAGGYRQASLWDESILPGVLEFIDRTGNPGPKYWQNGCYPEGEEKTSGGRRQLVRSRCLCPMGRQTITQRRGMGEGRQLAGSNFVHNASSAEISLGRLDGPLLRKSLGFRARMNCACRSISRRSKCGRRISIDRQCLGMDNQQFQRRFLAARSFADVRIETFHAAAEHPRRRIRYVFRQSGLLPVPKRRESAESTRNNIGFRCVVGVCDLTLVRPGRA